MKAVFVASPEGVIVKDVLAPYPKDDEIVVRMKVCGLCGSDLEKTTISYGMGSTRLGHEPVGEIAKVGNNVTGFKEMERVFTHHHVPCYSCYYCSHNAETMCDSYQLNNLEPCGLSEEFLVSSMHIQRGGVLKLPTSVTDEEASLIEPLACCIRALNKCDLKGINDIVIMGAGPVGIMNALLARDAGVKRVILIDPNEFRLDFGKRMGFEVLHPINDEEKTRSIKDVLSGRGADLVVVATGNQNAFIQSLKMLRKGGSIVLFGVPARSSFVNIDLSFLYANEISILSSYAATEVETNLALKLLADRRLNFGSLITHQFNLENSESAFRCALDAVDAMKVVIVNEKKK
ncbi:MAG: zinc-binding dehydrogenase [Nitrososphaeraceae archaeon]